MTYYARNNTDSVVADRLTNLLETFENWTKALDEGCGLDVVYLDYRKAFDSVPHRRLIEKLKSLELIENCYSGWKTSSP